MGLCQPGTGRMCWAGSSAAGRGTGQDSARHARDVAKCFATRVQTMYRTPFDVHRDVAPQRGMAAAQPLTATRHDSLGQDVDGSAVRAVSAVQGRGCWAPLEPQHGLGVPRAGCGRAAGLIRACGQTKAEPVQALPEGSCFPRSQPEGHWADPTPPRHCRPARGAGGSQAGPGPP